MEKEIRAGSDVMALVAIEETESAKEIPKEVEPILAEFVHSLTKNGQYLSFDQ